MGGGGQKFCFVFGGGWRELGGGLLSFSLLIPMLYTVVVVYVNLDFSSSFFVFLFLFMHHGRKEIDREERRETGESSLWLCLVV